MTLPRRISFSTSCERDKPFNASRPMLATRTARSCPPVNDLLTPLPSYSSRSSSEAEPPSRFSIASLLSPSPCALPPSSLPPSSSAYAGALSVSPSSSTGASRYSAEPAPPTRVKPSSSLYALLNPVDEPCPYPAPLLGAAHTTAGEIVASESEFAKSEVFDDALPESEVMSGVAVREDDGHEVRFLHCVDKTLTEWCVWLPLSVLRVL